MRGKKVLVIEDDSVMRDLVKETFQEAGAQVSTAADGKEGIRVFYTVRPDLVILDLMMPEMDGWETCRHIRELSNAPIIIVTVHGGENEIISGLEHGADDFVTKPFNVNVLVARAKATLRRAELPVEIDQASTFSDDRLFIDVNAHHVLVEGKPVKMTRTEHRLLAYLLKNANRVRTSQQILENVWGWDYQESIEYARIYIFQLRKKLEADPKNPKYLLTEHGLGYKFQTRPD